jgi:hypothetical protein
MKIRKRFKKGNISRHSQRPKNGDGGGGDATTQQCNGKIETSKERKINKNKKLQRGKQGSGPSGLAT